MTIPEYVDDYFNMKHPNARKKYQDLIDASVREFLDARGVDDPYEFGVQCAAYWADMRKREADKADKRILELYGFTVDDLVKVKAEKERKRSGGKTQKPATKFRPIAFTSFLESEKGGRSFADAIKEAKNATWDDSNKNQGVSEKTLREWLSNLTKFGVCEIAPPVQKVKFGSS